MPAPFSREVYERILEAVHEALEEGYPVKHSGGGPYAKTAIGEAARKLDMSVSNMQRAIASARRLYGMVIDESRFIPRPPPPPKTEPMFRIEGLPDDGECNAEELIGHLKTRHQQRKIHNHAAKLRQVHLTIPGPIGLAFIGDPHIDDPGCAWGDLERDIRICRETQGILAVNVGDVTNNWVGRLERLYADQEVTTKQARKLSEWFMGSCHWLLHIKGNHDEWNTSKGDIADYIHRILGSLSVVEGSGARMQVHSPNGSSFKMHVRHDFPGGSQFNPAHAMVRETLFGHRDHILACGHRHTTGYIPVWHQDPVRLCHGFRCGAYKDFDHYAKEKGFQDSNWSRALGATIDPDLAHDPVRYIKPWFDLEDMAEYLTWRRQKHELGSTKS